MMQFRIGPYRIDLYLAGPKIAIECDEHGHRKYDQGMEAARELFIKEHLGCCFVRYDPFTRDFSVNHVAARVVENLVGC